MKEKLEIDNKFKNQNIYKNILLPNIDKQNNLIINCNESISNSNKFSTESDNDNEIENNEYIFKNQYICENKQFSK